jgi:hypothetical protein
MENQNYQKNEKNEDELSKIITKIIMRNMIHLNNENK